MQDGWGLELTIDSVFVDRVKFVADDFTDISNASADEVVAAINRQTTNCFAIPYENSITKETTIRIFTNTIGSKGSVAVTGGLANIGLRFNGFHDVAGYGSGTEYEITTVGDTVSLRYTGNGDSPNFNELSIGDYIAINRVGNEGTFIIEDIDLSNDIITYTNLFATEETFTVSSVDDVKFFEPYVDNVNNKKRKAVVWEVRPGEISVEMPPLPPVVKRNRKGAAHINGVESIVINTIDENTLEVDNIDEYPDSGRFFFIPKNEILTYFPEQGDTSSFQYNSKLSSCLPVYTYSSKSGNNLEGIQPSLPNISSTVEIPVVSANRNNNNIITCVTSTDHNFSVGEIAIIKDAVLGAGIGADTNGSWEITEIVSPTEFKCYSFSGSLGERESTGGTVTVESIGMANAGSKIILTTAKLQPNALGPYVWDENAEFVLSSNVAELTSEIKIGTTQRSIEVNPNDIPSEEGMLIFDFGTERQEGPVRFFYKPNENSIAIDPSYVFEHTHAVGSAVTMIRRRGGISFSGTGSERAPYITDPAAAREVLQELMEEVKSVGIFIDFIIRYPVFYYATIDTYRSGIDPG